MDDAALNAITDPAALRALLRETMAEMAKRDATLGERDAASGAPTRTCPAW